MILLKKIPKCRFLFLALLLTIGATAFAQKVKITGTVTDPGGEPLIGVSERCHQQVRLFSLTWVLRFVMSR